MKSPLLNRRDGEGAVRAPKEDQGGDVCPREGKEVLVPEGRGSKGEREAKCLTTLPLPAPLLADLQDWASVLCPSWASPSPAFPPCLGLTSVPLYGHPAQHTIRRLL